jgi:PAS domain S-box-containing protein
VPPIDLTKNTEPSIIGQSAEEAILKTLDDELECRVQQRTLELQHTSEAFSNARELLQVTLACIGDAVITTDVYGSITFLNPIAERLTGWTSAQASGLPIARVFRILAEESREPAEDPVVRCMRDGQVRGLAQETLLIRRDGDEISIDDTAAPIFNLDKKMVVAVLIFRDVTEKRGLARQLAHQAEHDSLTGLTNRREFERRLKSVLAKQDRNKPYSLLYIFTLMWTSSRLSTIRAATWPAMRSCAKSAQSCDQEYAALTC